MSDETAPSSIPWYQSAIVRRLALSIAVQLLAAFHLSKYLAGADLSILVDDLLEAAGMAYAAWAIHARATKPLPPLTLTRAAAIEAAAPLSKATPPAPPAKD